MLPMRHRIYIAALATSLALYGTAQAHRPPLTLATADHYAEQRANDTVTNYLCDESGTNPDEPCLSGFEIDPCQRLASSTADCDVTYYYADGTESDTIVTVHSSRHNGVIVRQSEPAISD